MPTFTVETFFKPYMNATLGISKIALLHRAPTKIFPMVREKLEDQRGHEKIHKEYKIRLINYANKLANSWVTLNAQRFLNFFQEVKLHGKDLKHRSLKKVLHFIGKKRSLWLIFKAWTTIASLWCKRRYNIRRALLQKKYTCFEAFHFASDCLLNIVPYSFTS